MNDHTNKIFTLCLCGIMLIVVTQLSAATQEVGSYTWMYRIVDGEAEIYNTFWISAISPSPSGLVEVPTTLGGKPVTSIGDHAFYNCTQLSQVDIPATVKNVAYDAFLHCPSLADENGLVIIRDIVFGYYGKSDHVVLPEGVKVIGYCAFEDNNVIRSITIPPSVTYIDKGGLQSSSIRSIFIQDLKNWCNSDHSGRGVDGGYTIYLNGVPLKDLVVPEGVLSLDYTFANVICIESVHIPDSVASIGSGAFEDCANLKSINVSDGNLFYKSLNNLLLSKDGKNLVQGVNGCVTIPDCVSKICNCAFSGCSNLSSVTISPNVTSIGSYAFEGCSGLTSLTMSSNVTSIGWGAFSRCSALKSIGIPRSLTSVAGSVFYGCNKLVSVSIPSSVTSIGWGAFDGCGSLTVVYVDRGDGDRVRGLYAWPSNVRFVEFTMPILSGDVDATITGDAELGFVIKPSGDKKVVELSIPADLDAGKVTVEVPPTVERVTPNGAKIKIARDDNDITAFLNVPTVDGDGVVDLTKASVKDAIVKEAMDPKQGAVIEMNVDSTSLTTPNTRKGLVYKLREGATLKEMQDGDSKIGDGQPWSPTITVKGGSSAFYSISVEK